MAELVALAELALADRARLRVSERDNAIGDLLAGQPYGDLLGDGRGQLGGLLELLNRGELALRATAAQGRSGLSDELACITDRARNQLAGLPSQLEDLLTRAAGLSKSSPDSASDQPQPSPSGTRAILNVLRSLTDHSR